MNFENEKGGNMLKLTKMILCAIAAIAIASGLNAAILHPEMTVAADAGTYDKPAGTLGEKPAEAWTATTIAAGVDKKPQPGKIITEVGEIIDLSCYLQLGKHGEKHKACGTKCLQNSQPIGLLTKSGEVFLFRLVH